MTQSDVAIYGAAAVLPDSRRISDILIKNGRITAILKHTGRKPAARRIIDARGKTALSGVVDPHVHFNLPAGNIVTADDFVSGSLSALAGGVTTVLDFTTQGAGTPLAGGIASRLEEMKGALHCDYALHCVIPSWKKLRRPGEQMRRAALRGVTSFKMFMIYESRGMRADDADLYQALLASKSCGALVCLHAESDTIINHLIAVHKGEGARGHARSRPDFTEWEAVQRALVWTEAAKAGVYFVHLSAGRSAEIIGAARARGIQAMGETCPQYLTLDDSIFSRKNGHYYATCPQVKTKKDSAGLWRGLREGTISTVGTDSCTFTAAQKNRWGGDFTKIPCGMPGVETALPLLYTHGVLAGKISLVELSRLLSANPAKIMGLYPRKGALIKGADADIVLIDPRFSKTVDWRKMQSNCDWNPYQGMKLKGWPETVLLRGEIVVEGGAPVKGAPKGRFTPCGRPAFV